MIKEDIIYASGFIDGEGCITTSHNNFRITLSNTNKNILLWLQTTFGGNLNDQYLPKNSKHNLAWKWVICSGKDLIKFLDLVIPYLKIKKPEAILVRDYLCKSCMRLNWILTDKQKSDYEFVKDKLRKLKTDLHYNRD